MLALERRRLAVLRSSDGSVAAKIDTPAGVGAWSITWETDRTLLALMERAGRVAIVRLGIDGNLERVTPAVPAKPGRTPYVLLPPPPVPEHTEDH